LRTLGTQDNSVRAQGTVGKKGSSIDGVDDEGTVRLPIGALLPADSPRLEGENADHVRVLAELDERELPPVVVDRVTMRVIDGMHRLRASRLRGRDTVRVRFYDGDENDAFVVAVRFNNSHGLPLSLADRTAAATRLISMYPQWSDRRIAEVTGLSAATVRVVRTRSTAGSAQSNRRLGRDGRHRPLSSADSRLLASQLIKENPDAPLRQIALAAGLAPSTALDVRDRLRAGRNPVPRKLREGGYGEQPRPTLVSAPKVSTRCAGPSMDAVLHRVRTDPSLRFTETGRTLLRLFDNRLLHTEERARLVSTVPAHCATTIALLARQIAEGWRELAAELEQRDKEAAES
jgi:ParB-like chromosome segregation protein Spo0J